MLERLRELLSYSQLGASFPLITALEIAPSTSEVEILHDPKAYYEFILQQIKAAKTEIILSALYLGSGVLEGGIVAAIHEALAGQPQLRVTIILDHSRAQRDAGLWDYASPEKTSLLNLLQSYPSRAAIYWYQMPQLRWPCIILPPQICEILGVYHVKFALFDGGVMLSGANLSAEYFVDRQDRYMFFPRSGDSSNKSDGHGHGDKVDALAWFLRAFTRLLEPHCHRITAAGKAVRVSPPRSPPSLLSDDLQRLLQQQSLADTPTTTPNTTHAATYTASTTPATLLMLPLLQHSYLGLRHESSVLPSLLRALAGPTMQPKVGLVCTRALLSTPYPSLPPALVSGLHALARSTTSVSVLTASEEAHGFANAGKSRSPLGWLKAQIPKLHNEALRSALGGGEMSVLSGLSVLRFARPGWTFHAKGLWLWLALDIRESQKKATNSKLRTKEGSAPIGVISYIGSSNLGMRSWGRDFELGFLVAAVTTPKNTGKVLEALQDETRRLAGGAKRSLAGHRHPQGPWSPLPLLSRLLRSYL